MRAGYETNRIEEDDMAKARVLTQELRIGEFDDEELTAVLTSVLPRGAQFRSNEVEYRTMADEWVLSLHYRDGRIEKATAGSAMTAEHLQRIQAEIARVLGSPASTKVSRWTMFSSRPVEASWRYREQFQLVPAPPQAPRPQQLIAQHPFIVDFVFSDSPDWGVRRMRYGRPAADLMLVLNVLLTSRITAPRVRNPPHLWVWAPQGSTPPVMWAGEGYMIPDFQYLVDQLPDIEGATLDMVPAAAYYDRWEGRSDTLNLPAELPTLLDAFHALTDDNRDRFLRACYWYHTASAIWDSSQSLYLTCLINSIECLSSVGPQRATPEGPSALFKSFMQRFAPARSAAGSTTRGPSALFRSVMRRFAPGPPSGGVIDKIYEARSKITHGERLLSLDQTPGSWALNQLSSADREIVDTASILCQAALINWLWNQTAGGNEQLITHGLRSEKPPKPGTKSGVTVIVPEPEND
jgi:hypothetical protein